MKKRLLSFKYAFEGIFTLFKEEPNARIHLVATGLVVGLGYYLDVQKEDWIMLIACIGSVLFAEAINSSIEALADHVTPEKHAAIKKVKDLAAAGVLFVAVTAAVIGGVIFWPYLF